MRRRMQQNFKSVAGERGFTIIEIGITLLIISTVTTFAVMGVTRVRRAMRLSASERELAGYLEKARMDSMRRHATDPAEMATIEIPAAGGTTYTVKMDFDKDGVIDAARTVSLRDGVVFEGFAKTIQFNWRGQIASELSIGLKNEANETTNVNITGSGDITLNTEIFQDSWIPNVDLENDAVSGDVISDTAVSPLYSPTPTPSTTATTNPHATPTPSPSTSPTPTTSTPTPTPTPTSTPTPTPTPTPSPTATPAATATPTPVPCTLSVSPSALTIAQNGGGTFFATIANPGGSITVTAVSQNAGQIQVSPSSQIIDSSGGTVSFSVTVKKSSGQVTISTSANCGTQVVAITVP